MAVAYGVFRGPTAVPVAAVPEAQLPVAGKIPTPVPPTAVDVTAAPELPGPDSTDDDALTSLEPSAVDATDSDYSGDELGLPDAAEYGPVTPSKRISALLEFAQSLLPMQRLQLPPEANATLLFSRVLELEPDNEDARAGLAAVVDAYLQLTRQDLDAGRVAEGKDRLDRARQVAATPGLDVAALNARIDLEWNTRIASLKTAARTALDEWRGADAENLISQALTLVPNDGELLKWMREAKVMDFGSQMSSAARLAVRCPQVGEELRARYRVVLLDEYQDTGHAQRVALSALFGGGVDGGLALTAVGDPIQSIYGWRGASATNLPRFTTDFPFPDGTPAPTLELRTSWRNPPRALTLANAVSAEARRRSVAVRPLRPRPDADPGTVLCALHRDVQTER